MSAVSLTRVFVMKDCVVDGKFAIGSSTGRLLRVSARQRSISQNHDTGLLDLQ